MLIHQIYQGQLKTYKVHEKNGITFMVLLNERPINTEELSKKHADKKLSTCATC